MEIYIFKMEEKKIIKKGEYKGKGNWMFNSNFIWEKNIIRTIGNDGDKGGYGYFGWDVKEKDM